MTAGRTFTAMHLLAAAALLLLSAFVSAGLTARGSAAGAAKSPDRGILLAMSRRAGLTFGFRNALADIVWLDAVQVAGSRRLTPGDYDRLDALVRTVNNFDPAFRVPYLLGGLVLGDSPAHVPQAVDAFRRGRDRFPRDWRFPFYIGYTLYFSRGDTEASGKALEEASLLPDSPPFLPLLASRILSEGRRPELALELLRRLLAEESDPARVEILRRRAREVIVERDIQLLEAAAERYRAATGRVPPSLGALVEAGILRGVPREPHGGRYLLLPDGRTVRSDRVADRLRVFRIGK